MNNKIFIQIAAYRDPQLIPTIKDCIAKARYPENLVFSITWQHSETDAWDNLSEFEGDKRFKIIDVNYKYSKGACWARNLLQQQYSDEDYTLQLDSHHRFVENWDEECIEMIKLLQSKGHAKPLLTGYMPSFNPNNDPQERVQIPWKMNFDRFIPEGAIFFLPASIDNFNELTEPIPSRFYSAHFCFTLGQFVVEVPHDPEYYFHGEEISVGVRAFTWGYDLFHPHKLVVWHEYTRVGRTKHWDDDPVWVSRNTSSHKKNRQLFGMDGEVRDRDFGIYDFGKIRSLREYEVYSGISFKNRSVTKNVVENISPSYDNLHDDEFDSKLVRIFKHCIDIDKDKLYIEVEMKDENNKPIVDTSTKRVKKEKKFFDIDDCDFWVVAFENAEGKTIFRRDVDSNELDFLKNDPSYYKVWREFSTDESPAKWIVWIHSKTYGWANRLEGMLI